MGAFMDYRCDNDYWIVDRGSSQKRKGLDHLAKPFCINTERTPADLKLCRVISRVSYLGTT